MGKIRIIQGAKQFINQVVFAGMSILIVDPEKEFIEAATRTKQFQLEEKMDKDEQIIYIPNVKEICGNVGSGKTFRSKLLIGDLCKEGVQCIVFSFEKEEYLKACEQWGGTYVPVTGDYAFNGFPETNAIIFDFGVFVMGDCTERFKGLLHQVSECIKLDAKRRKCFLLDLPAYIYDRTTKQITDLAYSVRRYNAMMVVTHQL